MRWPRNCRPAVLLFLAFAGCSHWRPPALPVADSITLDQLVVYSDFEVPQKHRLLDELNGLRAVVAAELQLPASDEPVHVYLFKTPRRYQAFMQRHFGDYPQRRALFVETDTQLNVYAHWGDHVAEDLRHEVCHGYLHAALAGLPLWLDEGLAEYFELDRGREGFHAEHLASLRKLLVREDWLPDLARLEQLQTIAQMEQLDYAESWAWVHFLLKTEPQRREILLNYLRDLPQRGAGRPLSERLRQQEPEAAIRLRQHLRGLIERAAVR
ncbi:MAG: DUF1570 domain-containing protein [Planctomycetales bacterium]|nr:DUF1570 domain-containing protein [Planctomycetales bacterium]